MRQPQERDPKTVDEADQHSNGRPDQNDDRPRPACLIGHGEQHDGERHDRADRKVDAGGEDDEVHPEREQRVHPNLADDVGDVLRREEVLRLQDRQGCGHHHDDDQDAVFAKQPRTEIARAPASAAARARGPLPSPPSQRTLSWARDSVCPLVPMIQPITSLRLVDLSGASAKLRPWKIAITRSAT